MFFFFFQAEDGIRDSSVTGVQTCALPISPFGAQSGIEYLFIAVVGGAGYVWGGVVGAAIVVILKEILQSYLPYVFGGQASSRPSYSASSWCCCCNWRRPGSGPG